MTIFHLVRHGSYGLIGKGLGGRDPHGLSEEGRLQAERVADRISGKPIRAILSSPVERAKQTAAPLVTRLGLDLETDPAFAEIDFGSWTGASFEDLENSPDWHAWNVFRCAAKVPGGETMLAVQARAMSGILRLAMAWPESEVAVFSHGDIVKVVLAAVLGIPLDLIRRLEISPGSVSVLSFGRQDAHVLSVNQHG